MIRAEAPFARPRIAETHAKKICGYPSRPLKPSAGNKTHIEMPAAIHTHPIVFPSVVLGVPPRRFEAMRIVRTTPMQTVIGQARKLCERLAHTIATQYTMPHSTKVHPQLSVVRRPSASM